MPAEISVQIVRNEDMNIGVGTKAVVEPQGVGERFASRFVGWTTNKYLILHLPSLASLRDHLYDGKKLVIRYMTCDGLVCGFETEVQGTVFTPQRILLVNYPEEIAVHNIRKAKRVSVFIGSELSREKEVCKCYMLNISLEGCQIALDASPNNAALAAIGSEMVVHFVLPGLEPAKYSIPGTLVRVSHQKDGAYTHFGIKFAALSETDSKALEAYVADAEKYMSHTCSIDK